MHGGRKEGAISELWNILIFRGLVKETEPAKKGGICELEGNPESECHKANRNNSGGGGRIPLMLLGGVSTKRQLWSHPWSRQGCCQWNQNANFSISPTLWDRLVYLHFVVKEADAERGNLTSPKPRHPLDHGSIAWDHRVPKAVADAADGDIGGIDGDVNGDVDIAAVGGGDENGGRDSEAISGCADGEAGNDNDCEVNIGLGNWTDPDLYPS